MDVYIIWSYEEAIIKSPIFFMILAWGRPFKIEIDLLILKMTLNHHHIIRNVLSCLNMYYTCSYIYKLWSTNKVVAILDLCKLSALPPIRFLVCFLIHDSELIGEKNKK